MAYGLPGGYDQENSFSNQLSTTTAQVRDDLSSTLRSMRDSLATSLQTLNLTMSGIHTQLRAMSPTFRPAPGVPAYSSANTYIPSYQTSANLGAMSHPMANHLATNSIFGLATAAKPYNIGGYEWAWERQKEMRNRATQFGVDTGINVATGLATTIGGNLAYNALAPRFSGLARMGRFLGGGAIGLGMGMAAYPLLNMVSEGAEQHGRDIASIRRLSPRFGNEFNNAQSAQVARGITNWHNNELKFGTDFNTNIGASGMREVLTQGLQMNMFQGNNSQELIKQMEGAAHTVKFLTGVLGSKDIAETMRYVGQMKNMGINLTQNNSFSNRLGMTSYKYGQTMGVSGADLLGQATQIGASAYGQYGMPAFGGILPAMQNMALAHELEKRRYLSTAEISTAGGHNGIASQMVNFTAGAMNHGGIGQMMLAAGWQGGGRYSARQMAGAVGKGGYFGAMGNAVGKLAGDVGAYSEFMMNQENLYASASTQGGLDAQTENVLFSALDQMPFMENDNSAGLMLKQIASSMGVNLSTAAAKTIVMKHRKPGLMRAFESNANRARDRGIYHRNKLDYGPMRSITRPLEQIGNIPGRIKNAVYGVGQSLQEYSDSFFGDLDGGAHSQSIDGLFTGGTVESLRKMQGWGDPLSSLGSLDPASFHSAYVKMNGGIGNGLLDSEVGAGNAGDRTDATSGAAVLTAMRTKNHRGYYQQLMGGADSMGAGEAYQNLRGLGVSNFNIGREYQELSGGVTEALANGMGKGMDKFAAHTTDAGWYKHNLTTERAKSILSEIGIDHSNMSKDELVLALTQGGPTGAKLDAKARGLGVSRKNLAFAIANKEGIGQGEMSGYSKLFGASDDVFNTFDQSSGAYARSKGMIFNAGEFASQLDNNLGFGNEAISSSLGKLGLSMDDIREVMDSGGADDFRQVSEALSAVANGGTFDLSAIKNKKLRSAMDPFFAEGGRQKLESAIGGDSILGWDGLLGSKDMRDRTLALLGKSGSEAATTNMQKGLSDIYGFNIDSSILQEKLKSGGLPEYLLSQTTTSNAGKELKDKLGRVKGLSMDDVKSELANRNISTLNLSDADMRNKLMEAQLNADYNGKQESQVDDTPKSLVDKAITNETGQYSMRVVYADANIDKAATVARTPGAGTTGSRTTSGQIGGTGWSTLVLSQSEVEARKF